MHAFLSVFAMCRTGMVLLRVRKGVAVWFEVSGGASAVKKPGHFEVRKSSSQVTRKNFFPPKNNLF